ncbi:hypothetical protein IWZ00DRAFT_280415 [Phyllosticta capitalensis]|uniref:uncharacterized protein n=1 Tax=Phyllosticta capitalensis TaxID=121624 RepID=UPI0031319119
MAATRAISARFGCNGCRVNVLRSFASLSGFEWSPRDSPARSFIRAHRHQRTFSSNPARFSDNIPQDPQKAIESDEQILESNATDPSVPWYLQVDAPQRAVDESPLAQRQKLPELPEHPPPMLETLLQHASVELGLDDITLLDLRELDPPPALGANLIMLFGTARSEKHLHVAADRLCRWLRSQYKLRAHADGLLGRNELKLKLRRKAKKMRMLSAAGASPTSLAADDGIRTDWICVNAGSVEAAASAPLSTPQREGFVGFREEVRGVHVVFQMFTEEKRVELDLEGLWNGVLKTDRRTKEALKAGEVSEEEQSTPEQNPNGAVLADQTLTSHPKSPNQSRGLHTLVRPNFSGTIASRRVGTSSRTDDQVRIWRKSMSTLDWSSGLPDDIFASNLIREDQEYMDNKPSAEKKRVLDQMLKDLESMSFGERKSVFSKGIVPDSKSLSPFLKNFFGHIPLHGLDKDFCLAMFKVYVAAFTTGRADSVDHILGILREMQVSGFPISEDVLLAALRTLGNPKFDDVFGPIRQQRLKGFARVLSIMEQSAHHTLTEKIFVTLHDSFSLPCNKASGVVKSDTQLRRRADWDQAVRSSLLQIVERTSMELHFDTFFLLLETYARLEDAERLIHIWRTIPLHMLPRSADMYAFFLNAMAKLGTVVQCIESVRECMAQRDFENPAVSLSGEVAKATQRCILRIDQRLLEKLEEPNKQRYAHNEWVRLWSTCEKASGRAF